MGSTVFSLGDGLELARLLRDVYNCLGSEARASTEFKRIEAWFRSLSYAVTMLKGSLVAFSDEVDGNHGIMRQIRFHGVCCTEVLREFVARTKKLHSKGANYWINSRRMKNVSKILSLAFGGNEKLRSFHEQLEEHVNAFGIYCDSLRL